MTTRRHSSKAATSARPTVSDGTRPSKPCAASTSGSTEGEMVAIMGPSGSGKSTLMHILGLLHAPGPEPRPATRAALRRPGHGRPRRGRADPDPGPPDGLRLPGLQPGPDPDRARERHARLRLRRDPRPGRADAAADEALDLVGLGDRGGHRPAELSGGEQQRAAIARALVNRPSLILADEPTGNLDSERSAEVLALLRRFNREHGQTLVLVTHDAEVGRGLRPGRPDARRPGPRPCAPSSSGGRARVARRRRDGVTAPRRPGGW